MNQILVTEYNKKTSKKAGIKGIIMFFAFSLILFGLTLLGEGSYAIYKNIQEKSPSNIPIVNIRRENDELVVNITHSAEIMKIKYSWDMGEENIVPINAYTAEERIKLLGYNSTLTLTIEDFNGKQITYQKQYILDGVDITKPSIDVTTSNGSSEMVITAADETAISKLTYKWDGEEEVTIYAETQNQKEIKKEITLTPGTRTITITAEDKNGNIQEMTREIVTSTSKPKMSVLKKENKVTFHVEDEDGVKYILVNLNGETYSADNINRKEVDVGPLTLREGNNILSIEVTNISGYTESAATELEYTAQ